ncbi:MAG: histidinol-phosphate transaminase [Planctomycetia bacterium]|nr:histidinol-phosphate transaminase [Planctomycetia bacterium]
MNTLKNPVRDNPVRDNIAQMPGYVPGEQPQSGTFVKLNTNECPYPPSPQIAEACRAAIAKGLNRYPDPMANGFRHAAGRVLGIPPEYILAGNGSDDILTILTRTYVGEGEILRLAYPSYILYKSLAQLQGARWEEVPFDAHWNLTPRFAEAIPGLKLVYLPNPNSPSGTLVQREEILALADKLPCPLVVDEAYADFAEYQCVDLVLQNPNIIVTRTLSKSYGLAGLRFGFVIAHPDKIEQFVKVKDSYNCDALSIAAATAAMEDREWFHTTRAKILQTRGEMETQLRGLGFDVTPSHANFLWCTMPSRPLQPVYQALKSRNIFVRYMPYPDWPYGNGEGLRISVGTENEVETLGKALREIL